LSKFNDHRYRLIGDFVESLLNNTVPNKKYVKAKCLHKDAHTIRNN